MTNNTLADAMAARQQAEQQLQAANAATRRAREVVAAAASEVTRLAAEERGLEERYATELEERMLASEDVPALALVPSDREGFVRQREAAFRYSAAQRALARLEAAETAARAAVQVAQQNEQAVIADAKREETERIATEMRCIEARYAELFAVLAVADLDGFGSEAILSESAFSILRDPFVSPSVESLVGGMGVLDINTPLNGHREKLENAREHWVAFEATLRSAAEPAEQAA